MMRGGLYCSFDAGKLVNSSWKRDGSLILGPKIELCCLFDEDWFSLDDGVVRAGQGT
jgi:hypothetical protein